MVLCVGINQGNALAGFRGGEEGKPQAQDLRLQGQGLAPVNSDTNIADLKEDHSNPNRYPAKREQLKDFDGF